MHKLTTHFWNRLVARSGFSMVTGDSVRSAGFKDARQFQAKKRRHQKAPRLCPIQLEPLEQRQLLSAVNVTDNWAVDNGSAWPSAWTAAGSGLTHVTQNVSTTTLPGSTADSQSNLTDSVGHVKSTSGVQNLAIYRNDAGSILNSVQFVTFEADANGGDQVGLASRGAGTVGSGTDTYYSVQTSGMGAATATLTIDKNASSGTSTVLATESLANSFFTKNNWYTLEFYVHTDPTNTALTDLAANVWATATGSANPTGWQISTTDGTTGALQSAGTSGIWYQAHAGGDDIYTTAYSLANSLTPTISTYTASTTSVARSSAVTFNATGVDSDIHPQALANYTLNYGDGTTPLSQSSAVTNVSHTYTLQGSYNATLTITDADGQTTSRVIPIAVTPKSGDHSASISTFTQSALTGAATLTVTFNATGSASGDAVSYNLNYGDGASLTQTSAITNVTHPYTLAGSYQAVLTITDTVDGSAATQSQGIGVTSTGGNVPLDLFAATAGSAWTTTTLPWWTPVNNSTMATQSIGADTALTISNAIGNTYYLYKGPSYQNSVQQVTVSASAGGTPNSYAQAALVARGLTSPPTLSMPPNPAHWAAATPPSTSSRTCLELRRLWLRIPCPASFPMGPIPALFTTLNSWFRPMPPIPA